MGRDFKVKETDTERIKRWLDTPSDAYGLFVSLPNQIPINHFHRYYGEHSRAEYNYQESKRKRASLTD